MPGSVKLKNIYILYMNYTFIHEVLTHKGERELQDTDELLYKEFNPFADRKKSKSKRVKQKKTHLLH